MAHKAFDEQMNALDALKGAVLTAADVELIKKALRSKSNFLVAKAAKLAEENGRAELIPDLSQAFDRFFTDAEKCDPQCWAKNALIAALSKLGCRDKDVFLRGLHFKQMEPVWGGRSDTAGTLRAQCAHGLIGCEGLIAQDLLLLLLDLLADEDKTVRVEAVRALSQLEDLAAPVLRLRALIPGEDAEVLSACFHSLLDIDLRSSIPFVSRFLSEPAETAAEAAFALAETHAEPALNELLQALKSCRPADLDLRSVLLQAVAATRLPRAIGMLVALVEDEDRAAPEAIRALGQFCATPEVADRLETAVADAGSPRLRALLTETFAAR